MHGQQPPRLGDRGQHRLHVQRHDAAQVHHLDIKPVLGLELFGGFQRLQQAVGEGDQGQVLALALDVGLADGDSVFLFGFGHIAARKVEHLVLQEEHGVLVADRGEQQPLGVIRGGGDGHLDAGELGKGALDAGAVLRAVTLAAAVLAANDHGHVHQPAGHVAHARALVEDLVGADQEKVHVHQLDDRAQPHHGRTDGHAHKALLADRRVDHAALAELFHQVARDAEEAAVVADVLANGVDALVAAHLLTHGFVDCLDIGCLAHDPT